MTDDYITQALAQDSAWLGIEGAPKDGKDRFALRMMGNQQYITPYTVAVLTATYHKSYLHHSPEDAYNEVREYKGWVALDGSNQPWFIEHPAGYAPLNAPDLLFAEVKRLRHALDALVATRGYKLEHGKNETYQAMRKEAWELADDALKQIGEF
jgi:hypothetical protein